MEIRYARVSSFSRDPFRGNPAGVCPLAAWLPDELMLRVAAENAISETAFFVARGDGDFDLRWFTPAVEVDLCGHATLASALVLMERLEPGRTRVRFHTRSGPLEVERTGDGLYALDLPAWPPAAVDGPVVGELARALGRAPTAVLRARDLVAVYERPEEVASLEPDLAAVAALDAFAVCVTAPGGEDGVDFVSRFFAPADGVPEDPVTGSAHCQLVPYWSERLGRRPLRARQVSRRGGEMIGEWRGDRVWLAAPGVLVTDGVFFLP